MSARGRLGGILAAAGASLALLLGAPLALDRGTLNDLWNLAFAVAIASSWNLLGGFAGQISIGYSAFVGVGAYTTVLLALAGVDPYTTIPLAALAGAAFSFVDRSPDLPAPRPILHDRDDRRVGGHPRAGGRRLLHGRLLGPAHAGGVV